MHVDDDDAGREHGGRIPRVKEKTAVPHIIVKLWPGPSEAQKDLLARAITRNVTDVLDLGEESVSVAIEEVDPRDWVEQVYEPDIRRRQHQLYKQPGYDPSELR
jgi:4-oxalocrotonate tautomerase